MSLEDLRDNYKNSRQSNDVKLKLNGATYRKIRSDINHSKVGNVLEIKDQGNMKDLEEFNLKYQVSEPNTVYSLNKKKRWQIASELTTNMSEFGKEDLDVRLYETRNRNEKKSNCIGIHKSKGDQVTFKKTYANLKSIKKREELDEIERRNPIQNQNLPVSNRKKKSAKVTLKKEKEYIYISSDNDESDEINNKFVQYEIEYPPKKDILKYGAEKFNHRCQFARETHKNPENFSNYEGESYSEEELSEHSEDDEVSTSQLDEGINVSLDDLINIHLDSIVKRHELVESRNNSILSKKLDEAIFSEKKDRKVYMDPIKKENNFTTYLPTAYIKCPVPKAVNLFIKNDTIEKENLKSSYGLRYTEAVCCWPRNFNINLNEEIKSMLVKKNEITSKLDIICWLKFQEVVQTIEQNEFKNCREFGVSIVCNLECETIWIDNLNTCESHDMEEIVKKSIDLVAHLPLEYYKRKELPKSIPNINKNPLVNDLPNIGGSALAVKTFEDLKLELFHNNKNPQKTFDRSNSIDVVIVKENFDLNENKKVQDKIEKLFNEKKYECILCFDQKENLNDCLLIKSCAHSVCNECMESYIDLHLRNSFSNAGKLQCPGCENHLDLALIINYASNANMIDLFLKNTVEKVIFVLSNYKWCPSQLCGKILQVDLNSNPYGTVSCVCGFKMCLRCNNQPHFPAKCSQLASYYKELHANNDFTSPVDENYIGVGKRCPNCQYFMEKNGGCNHMSCTMCRKEFCWFCLENWEAHDCKGSESTSQVIVELKKKRKIKNKDARYEDSIAHRRKRMPSEKRILQKQAKHLLESIKIHSDIKENNFAEKIKAISDKRKELRTFLTDIVEFVNEMHFVCEHAYLLLRDNNVDKSVRNKILDKIRKLERTIWSIRHLFEYGSGTQAIEELKVYYNKGLWCIKFLKDIKNEL